MPKKQQLPSTIVSPKHWGSLAKGYFNLAEIGLKSYKDKSNIGKEIIATHPTIKIPLKYCLKDGNTIIACIWNIKHGIELMLKSIGIFLDRKYWGKHDLDFLLKDIESKLQPYNVGKYLTKLKQLVDKYYNCKFSPKTVFKDFDNTYFKYPETKGGGALDYSFVHDLKKKDINKFLKDIHNLQVLSTILENGPIVSSLKKTLPRNARFAKYTLKNLGYKK